MSIKGYLKEAVLWKHIEWTSIVPARLLGPKDPGPVLPRTGLVEYPFVTVGDSFGGVFRWIRHPVLLGQDQTPIPACRAGKSRDLVLTQAAGRPKSVEK